jgi:hypothetical protein
MTATHRLGFDIGGTFTDFVLVDEAGTMTLGKCLTTPDDPSRGVKEGMAPLLADAAISGADIDIAIHATTLITNALIQRKGARIALLTTAGFRDTLEMATEVRYDNYDLYLKMPDPLVPRDLRFDIPERMTRDGDVLVPLDEERVRAVALVLRERAVEAVAVVYLHGFRNPAHERRTARLLAEALPGVPVSLSSVVAPEIREYERTSTTTANAYVQPIVATYLDRAQAELTGLWAADVHDGVLGRDRGGGVGEGAADPAAGIRPDRRGARGDPFRPASGHPRSGDVRHGRHHRQNRADQESRRQEIQRVRVRPRGALHEGQRPAGEDPDDRADRDRRGRRQHRRGG